MIDSTFGIAAPTGMSGITGITNTIQKIAPPSGPDRRRRKPPIWAR